jgi:tetratricopeptide (TPR) repeat protein
MGDYAESASIAEEGLVANPYNFTLLNNYSVAAAQMGQVDIAIREFGKIDTGNLSALERVVWLATSGLLCFEGGNTIEGRRRYIEAIRNAAKFPDPRYRAIALLYFAMEELRAASPEAENRRREALDAASTIPSLEIQPLIARLRTFIPSR